MKEKIKSIAMLILITIIFIFINPFVILIVILFEMIKGAKDGFDMAMISVKRVLPNYKLQVRYFINKLKGQNNDS